MRPKVFLLDLVDPERSLEDPALRALVAAGWTCSGSWPVVRDAGAGGPEKVQLMLLLWPPPSTPTGAVGSGRIALLVGSAGIVVGAVVGWSMVNVVTAVIGGAP